ncbi:ABC transporter permease [Ilumatobacter nonamiensis]|uniref:ABC transporter permease n=1 Tax=Ilumatobacter nonamiensis TaxID=467093 RepID=UPI0003452F3C|nr:ABC transporter permease [Ilumatobacter nonamiensis]
MGVAKFVVRRCAVGVLTIFVVSLLVFVLTRVLGDPAAAILGPRARQPEVLSAKRSELGLDRSLVSQYGEWLRGLISGEPGNSYIDGRPIRDDMLSRVGNSMVLMAVAAILAVPLSILIGVRAAVRRDRLFDSVTNVATLVLVALPEFLIAILLLMAFSIGVFEFLPATSSVRGDVRPWNDLDGMILPSITMALLAVPYVVRSMRASMMEVLDSDYVAAARMNQLSSRQVVWHQAWPNALPPTLQVIALSLTYIAGGAVVVEAVFNYPGIGTGLVEAITTHDVPVVQFIAMFISSLFVACNVAADVGTVLLTPRLRTRLT